MPCSTQIYFFKTKKNCIISIHCGIQDSGMAVCIMMCHIKIQEKFTTPVVISLIKQWRRHHWCDAFNYSQFFFCFAIIV